MWMYKQSDGAISDKTGMRIGFGYAGNGAGLNNSAMEQVHDIGPLPKGLYKMEEPIDTDTHGPYVIRLTPLPDTEMYGRSGMMCHGDKKDGPPKTASKGCVIAAHVYRQQMWNSGDHLLEVIA